MALRAQPLKMGMHKITGVQDATDDNDAVNLGQIKSFVITLPMFGGIGDDTTNDSAALQAAYDFIESIGGGTLELCGKTYLIEDRVFHSSNIVVQNGVLHLTYAYQASAGDEAVCLNIDGSLGSPISPSANILDKDTTITFASAPPYAEGDFLLITSDDYHAAAYDTLSATWSYFKRSQWVCVKSVSGTTVTLRGPSDYDFTTGINIYRPTLVENVLYSNVRFRGVGDPSRTNYLTAGQILVRPQFGRRIFFDHCQFEKSDRALLEFTTCIDSGWVNSSFSDCYVDGYSYGGLIDNGCERIVGLGSTGKNLRHTVVHGGSQHINRHCEYYSTYCIGARDSIVDAHPGADYITFDGVSGTMDTSTGQEPVMIQSSRTRVLNINVSDSSGPITVQAFSYIEDDWFELSGKIQGFPAASSSFGVTLDNMKPGGWISEFKWNGLVHNDGTNGRGVYIRQRTNTDIKKVSLNGTHKTGGRTLEFFAGDTVPWLGTPATGLITYSEIRGKWERINNTSDVMQLYGVAAAQIDQVDIDADIIGGDYGIVNPGSTGTNYRAKLDRITGYSIAAKAGTVATGPVYLTGSTTWNPPNIAAGDSAEVNVTVTGLVSGDKCMVTFSLDLTGLIFEAAWSAADTARCILANPTAATAINLGSGTVSVLAIRP